MSADGFKTFDVLLMINQDTGVLILCSSQAFHFAQGSIRSVVRRSHRDISLDSRASSTGSPVFVR